MLSSDRVPSGVPDVDALLGGLILGDNVVWVLDDTDVVRHLEDAMLAEAVARGEGCFYVTAAGDPAALQSRLGPGVTVLDARPRGRYGDAAVLETAIIEGARSKPPGYVVVDGLKEFSRRWGAAKAVAFFSRVCPRLFDLGAIAYWRAPRTALGRSFIDQITSVTQCVLEIGEGHLRVVKAEGRPASVQGRLLRLERGGRRAAPGGRAGPRAPRPGPGAGPPGAQPAPERPGPPGRRDPQRHLPGRGRPAGPVARHAPPALRAAGHGPRRAAGRRPRRAATCWPATPARRPTPRPPCSTTPRPGCGPTWCGSDPGESGAPDFPHKGAELVLVASGLVQLTIGDDTPVLRAGDVALATTVAVTGWRNLMNGPALLFWVLRDEPPARR